MDFRRGRLEALVGRDICVALVGGARLDDCQLVSCSSHVGTAWIVHYGDDVFVPIDAIADIWDVGRAGERSEGALWTCT